MGLSTIPWYTAWWWAVNFPSRKEVHRNRDGSWSPRTLDNRPGEPSSRDGHRCWSGATTTWVQEGGTNPSSLHSRRHHHLLCLGSNSDCVCLARLVLPRARPGSPLLQFLSQTISSSDKLRRYSGDVDGRGLTVPTVKDDVLFLNGRGSLCGSLWRPLHQLSSPCLLLFTELLSDRK